MDKSYQSIEIFEAMAGCKLIVDCRILNTKMETSFTTMKWMIGVGVTVLAILA